MNQTEDIQDQSLAIIEQLCELMGERERELVAAQEEINRLKQLLAKYQAGGQAGSVPATATKRGKQQIRCSELSVLIVDDSKLARLAMVKLLEGLAITRVMEADCGEDGLNKFKVKQFDLVLLDFEMKGGDGKWALGEFKRIRPEVPVVMVSGVLNRKMIYECLEAGASDFLVKPVASSILLPRLEKALGAKLV